LSSPLTVVLLAAGLGTRYGGLKQLDRLGPAGERLLDYALFDAWRVGFRRAIFVIRPEMAERFDREIRARYADRLAIEAVHQRLDDLPGKHSLPLGRHRPWGTTQAVLAARQLLSGNFVVLNADDCYGQEAMAAAARFLTARGPESRRHAVAGFRLDRTLSPMGGVSRAVLRTRADGTLLQITEVRDIRRDADGAFVGMAESAWGGPGDTLVSMNLWAMTPAVLAPLTAAFQRFLGLGPDERSECYLPEAMQQIIARGEGEVEVLPTESRWCGVTHAADRGWVTEALARATRRGEYPERLWD
jgi:dTDP-glucose pyrophosphorylase